MKMKIATINAAETRELIKMTGLAINPNVVAEAVCIFPKSGNLFTANVIVNKNQHIPQLIHWTLRVKQTLQLEVKQEKCTMSLGGK